MSSRTRLSTSELNAAALEQFIYTPVSNSMIRYLARAASNVIQCDPNMMPPPTTQVPTPPRTPSPKAVRCDESGLPSLEDFITQLVVSSNVQVPTLMSTLVYLNRLKSRLQPMAQGLRCTTHRIFLAALILAAKYLNDSSPKNKHWASYSNLSAADGSSFGFSRTEVNLMEKQLLFLLDWELRITEEDLYRELNPFLAPIREDIEAKHARRMQRRKQKEEEARWAAAAVQKQQQQQHLPTPPSSRGSSRSPSRPAYLERGMSSSPPPGLAYSSSVSSASSYASSLSSRPHSRSSTPLSDPADPYVATYTGSDSLYESPVEIVLDPPHHRKGYHAGYRAGKQLLPYEISAEDLREMQDGGSRAKRARTGRGVWGRLFSGSAHA